MKQVTQLIQEIDITLYNISPDIVYFSDQFPSVPPKRYGSWLQPLGGMKVRWSKK